MNDFLDTTLALIEASWVAYLRFGYPPNPTVYVNRGEEGSYPLPPSLPLDHIHPFVAAVVRESGATEAVFSSPYKRRGPFAKQSAIATYMTIEGLASYIAKLGNEGLEGWHEDRAATTPWSEGQTGFFDVGEVLRENARSLPG